MARTYKHKQDTLQTSSQQFFAEFPSQQPTDPSPLKCGNSMGRPSSFFPDFGKIYMTAVFNLELVFMAKDNVQWDYELLAVLSMYAEMPIKKLKKTVVKLSRELHIDLPKS
jgi:hypothetical protein